MRRSSLPLAAALLSALLSLSACGKTPAPSASPMPPAPSTSASSAPSAPTAAEASLSALREETAAGKALCAVAHLGDGENITAFLASAEGQALIAERPFLGEIPPELRLAHPGGGLEIYCVVPVSQEASLRINRWVYDESNDFAGAPGEALYERASGEPVLVRGNFSDILPDLEFVVEYGGETLHYQPFLSLRDGSLCVPEQGVLDFTDYHDPAFLGVWTGEPEPGKALELVLLRGGELTAHWGGRHWDGYWTLPEVEEEQLMLHLYDPETDEALESLWRWECSEPSRLTLTHAEGEAPPSGLVGESLTLTRRE